MVSLPDWAEPIGTFTKATCPVPGNNRHDDRLTRRDVPGSDSCAAANYVRVRLKIEAVRERKNGAGSQIYPFRRSLAPDLSPRAGMLHNIWPPT
jgi:hypothetical protein